MCTINLFHRTRKKIHFKLFMEEKKEIARASKLWTIVTIIVIALFAVFIGYAVWFKVWNQKMGNEVKTVKSSADAARDIGNFLENQSLDNPLEGVRINPFE